MRSSHPFLTARWRHLAMLNFEVPADLLASRTPAGTMLDSYRGRTMVTLVGFRFEATRVRGWSIPLHRDFDEVNLRFYVRRGNKRGVVFIKEIVPRPAIAWVARVVYNEPYIALPMRSSVVDGREATYAWHFAKRWNTIHLKTQGEPRIPAPGEEAEFVAGHYWGYTRQSDGGTLEYEVRHPPWRIWRAESAALDCDVAALYGAEFTPHLTTPCSAFVAEGSEVAVFPGEQLPGSD